MLKSLYIVFAGIPLVISSLASTGISNPKLPEPTKECPCSKDAPLPVGSVANMKAELNKKTPLTVIPMCPINLTTLCAVTGTETQEWCKPGGVFRTCENTDTDNDGDGTLGEAHFKMSRVITTYHCNVIPPAQADYKVCGDWQHVKIGVGSQQDACCQSITTETPCPAGACYPQPVY